MRKGFPELEAAARLQDERRFRAESLSRQLRLSSGGFLRERRGIVALSLVSIGAMSLISLYQVGCLRRLPQPPWVRFKSDQVDASDEAYSRFSTPDGVLGVATYAATMALAAKGAENRAWTQPWLPLAMAAKLGFDVAQMARMTRDQWSKHGGFGFWGVVAAGATAVSAALGVRESAAATREVRRRCREARRPGAGAEP